jgi:hypothetical protein
MNINIQKLLEEAIAQTPSLAVLCVIVVAFLRNTKSIFTSMQATNQATICAMRDMHNEHLDARALMRATIGDNVIATKENTVALKHLEVAISGCPKPLSPITQKAA